MAGENIDLLKRLCETPGVPGREERVRALIESEVKGMFDSTTVDAMPRLTKFSTSSRPMKPAPMTTACLTPWSMRALMRSMSCKFRRVKMPGSSMPGSGGRSGAAPGARISLS